MICGNLHTLNAEIKELVLISLDVIIKLQYVPAWSFRVLANNIIISHYQKPKSIFGCVCVRKKFE